MVHEEIEIDRMLAASGTGSPDLSECEDSQKSTGEALGYLPIVCSVVGQIIEKTCSKRVRLL